MEIINNEEKENKMNTGLLIIVSLGIILVGLVMQVILFGLSLMMVL